jgi:tetratricopeptide (TPR) repeat protein
MRWTVARSRSLALMALTLAIMPCAPRTLVTGQEAKSPAAGDSDTKLEKRLADLEKTIGQHVEAGRIAEAIPPARERLDLLVRLRGKDHWQAGDARRDVETYEQLAARPRDVQDRFAEARRSMARAEQLYGQGQYAQAAESFQKILTIDQEILGDGHPETADCYNNLAVNLADQGRPVEAEAMHRRALAIRLKALPEGHPNIGSSHNNLAETLRAQGKYAEAEAMHRRALAIWLKALGEEHPNIAASYNNLALTLWAQGKYAEAEAMHRRALTIRLKTLPQGHPQSATSYHNLAVTLADQGKYAEAEAMHRRALAIRLKALPEGHPDIAFSQSSLAVALRAEGKYAEAEAMHRRALAIRLKALPEGHPHIATSYGNLASALAYQGKYAEAEAMHRRALAIQLKALPEGHPDIASSYNSLATTLADQGRHAEAEAMLRRALAIGLKVLPEGHPDIALSYSNLAQILQAQGKYAEAEAMHRRALAIWLKALPEGHPHIAQIYNYLAGTLRSQGKHAEAETTHRRASAIRLKALPEGHPDIAQTYNNLAGVLADQGKYTEAEVMNRHALAICLKALPEGHPDIATSYNNLADSLDHEGKPDEALQVRRSAAAAYELARSFGPAGFGGAIGNGSPLPGLAAALARASRRRDAWQSWERDLARGLSDEVIRRAARPLTAAERDRETTLLGRGQAIDERINRLLAAKALTNEQEKTLDDLRQQASEIRRELLELERQFEDKYKALASRPATLEEAQIAIPEGTALVGWIDTRTEHWACLLGHSGNPVWVRLTGSGEGGAWTKEEADLSRRLRSEFYPKMTRRKSRPLAEALARQRLEPLKGHLVGIRRLIVVNSPGLAGIPVEVLLAARPDPAWNSMTVSYAPSAAMFVYLAGRPVPRDRPATLLAVADPAYPQQKDDAPVPEPPTSGLAVTRVVPNGNADLNGIKEGDILLRYGGTELKQVGDLKTIAADGGPKKVPVNYWREGITRDIEVAAGPLGVAIGPQPPAAFVRARRESERVLLGMRGGSRARLPGTRREVEGLAGLFPDGGATTILSDQACEATVQGLARSGKLKGYRYLHFATHGESDPRFAYRTALILAPDPDTSADPSALETDGAITAEQIARTWELDADLVVLSACESGLGVAAGAEGYLGFAQPLFARGARSLVLSQWKVDDDATSLLMVRFYQNLLGRRAGLKAPMPKAEALAEAKRWLRGAGPSEVDAALAALPRGKIVRDEAAAKVTTSTHPYEDPAYWAGFVLVGAPD